MAVGFRFFVFFVAVIMLAGFVSALSDPSLLYCQKLGYTTSIVSTSSGDVGYCIVKGNRFDSWAFFEGKVGQNYSYCAKKGYATQTATGTTGSYTTQYAVCVPKQNGPKVSASGIRNTNISVTDLMKQNGEALIPPTDLIGQLGTKNTAGSFMDRSVGAFSASIGTPSSFDWRNVNGSNWLTSVKDQASCGSCWAFATIGSVEAKFNIDNKNPFLGYDLSEQQLVSCSGGGGTCNGGWPTTALTYIQNTGVVDEKCLPYTASNSACSLCADWKNRTAKIDGYVVISNKPEDIKKALMQYGPLIVAIDARDMFAYSSGNYKPSGNPSGGVVNHAVVLVGWDDAQRSWIIKNSWGTSFGDKGYVRMAYGTVEAGNDIWAVKDTIKPLTPTPQPQPNPQPKPDPHDVPEYNFTGLLLVLAAGIGIAVWRRR